MFPRRQLHFPSLSGSVLCALLAVSPFASAAEPLFQTVCLFPVTPDNKPNYRIPAILQAQNGDLLVFAEKRNDGPGDIGNHDIVLKRSSDKGGTWGAEQMIFDDEKGVSTDITVGMDHSNGKLWLFFLRDKKKFVHFTSTDHGRTWQGPVSIHEQVTKPEWDALKGKSDAEEPANPKGRMAMWEKDWVQRYGCGPGNGMVQLSKGPKAGRLVVSARHREDIGKGRLRSFAHSFYSDDHGATWKLGGNIGMHTSECQLVELADCSLMVMSRNESSTDAPDNIRHLTAISKDGGETWTAPKRAEELISPRCHGPVERFTLAEKQGKNRLLFSSPASPYRQPEHPYGRYNLTVRLSYDEGATWTAGKTIWPHPSSYSDMVVLDDMTVGFIYERGPKGSTHYWDELHFVRFNLEWLTDGRDSLGASAIPASSP
ncbi:sialidase family protein [Roseimicrobium sp. ORNL1]|uniref:sialidase family protein n=1 Tax=Roseimicrobium sp. ORNL1 TaxID=2711231 RepID=UPI0013E1EFDE|nr:sialidase family protein [Roseimicrobium sp. ORNL1]QIF01542.1 exo-alpha-sialidase [Roseimicrobium sp. ORNL1]